MLFSIQQLLYLFLYPLFLYLMLCSSDFLSFWLFMEFSALIFICLLLASVVNMSYSSVIVYFLIQAVSSIGLLFGYLLITFTPFYISSLLFFLFIFLKLGLFPFNFWYFFSLINLPTVPLFLALTLQKLAPIYIYTFFAIPRFLDIHCFMLAILMLATLVSSSFLASSSITLVGLLIISSIFNSSWLLIRASVDFTLFLIYLSLYTILIYVLLFSNPIYSTIVLFTLIGLPPFPLFFLKFLVLYLFLNFTLFSFFSSFLVFLVLLTNVIILVLYFNYISPLFLLKYSNSFNI